jgi:uncharacterized membrane protein
MNKLIEWAAQGLIAPSQLEALGTATGVLPDRDQWKQALDRALLIGAVLLLAGGLIFFGAANWSGMSTTARFALAQLAVVVPVLLYWRWPDQRIGRAALAFGVLAIGALLALFGQTYQTGADPWQLFAAWAVLALPWVWLGRSSLLWLAWLALLDLAVWRWTGYCAGLWWLFDTPEWQLWAMFVVHGVALLCCEYFGSRGFAPGRPAYVRNVLYLLTLGTVTVLALGAIFGNQGERVLHLLLWTVTLGLAWWRYRLQRVDIAALASSALSVIVVVTAVLARMMSNFDDFGVWLLLALAVIAMTGTAGRWLLQLSREQLR